MKTRDEIIAGLTFEPFKYEEGPLWEGSDLMRPTQETCARVRTGAVLKLKNGGDVYFVGDCNEILGICDDCRAFYYKDIAEIAYLWDEPRVEVEAEEPSSWEENLKRELAKRGMLNTEDPT